MMSYFDKPAISFEEFGRSGEYNPRFSHTIIGQTMSTRRRHGQRGEPLGKTYTKKTYKKRSMYAGPRRGVTSKYAANPNKNETKTLDLSFTGAYNAVYTPDVQPQQMLNFSTATNSIQSLDLIQQGVGISQRVGNKVCLKSLRLRMALVKTGQDQTQLQRGRIMVLYDRNPNGAYIAANAILGASSQANVINAGTYTDNINPNLFDRFIVLMDEFITLPNISEASTITAVNVLGPAENNDYIVDRYIKLKNLECIFQATSNPATIANNSVGALLILTYGDATAGTNQAWTLGGTVRLRFADI
nr:MAG: capsid protein [Cressdnaviricota sp.]